MNTTLVRLSFGSIVLAFVGFACGLAGKGSDISLLVSVAFVLIPAGITGHMIANVWLSVRRR